MSRIILRADGSPEIGFGHLSRIISTARMLANELECVVVTNKPDFFSLTGFEGKVSVIQLPTFAYQPPDKQNENDEIPFDLEGIIAEGDIVVLDGYWFGKSYQKRTKELARKLVVIDDYAKSTCLDEGVDCILNHAPGVSTDQYWFSKADLLLGTSFAMLKDEFLQKARKRHSKTVIEKKPRKFFISFGASALMAEVTKAVVSAVLSTGMAKEVVAVTNEQFNDDRVRTAPFLSSSDLIREIENCDMAITPCSTMALEVCAQRKPLLCIKTAMNQNNIYNGLTSMGLAATSEEIKSSYLCSLLQEIDIEQMNTFVANQIMAIDGHSGDRILKYFKTI